MNLQDLQGKLVAVLGYGQEGKATTQYLLKHGIKPVLFDHKPWDEWPKKQQEEIKALGLNFIFGPDSLKELAGFNVAFRTPQLSHLHPDLQEAKKKGLLITSQAKWFFEHSRAKIIGVTGTKGKGTTCSLIYEILKNKSQNLNDKSQIYLTGNIGKTLAFEILDDLQKNDWVVYELSSFQLEDLTQSPHIAVVLMVTEDHLDRHTSIDEYRNAKEAVVKFQGDQDFAVVNADFDASESIGRLGDGQKTYFSRKKVLGVGCFVQGDYVVVKEVAGANFQYPISNIQLRGRHNLENICAATAVGAILDIDAKIIQSAVENFKGLEHRLELVAEKNGVKFYNDSISTNQDTTIAAIESFTEPEVLILGGAKKNLDFSGLAKKIYETKNIKTLVLVGQEAERLKQEIEKAGGFTGKILEGAKNMEEMVTQAASVAAAGDVVVLSPACTSFDMFKNYADRGEQFKNRVNKL